jgi:hypothetical protein
MRSLILAVALALATILTSTTGTYARSDTREETPQESAGSFQIRIFVESSELKTLSNVRSWIRNETTAERIMRHKDCLAHALHFEGGSTGEPEIGLRFIGKTITGRASENLSKWGGSDVCDVVFRKVGEICQFTFACLPASQRTPVAGAAWELSKRIAAEEIEGGNTDLEHVSQRHYLNPEQTSSRMICLFDREYVLLTQAASHIFYRVPRDKDEFRALQASDPQSCKDWREELRQAAAATAARVALAKKKKIQMAKRIQNAKYASLKLKTKKNKRYSKR